jgi:hypothetical protein
MPAINVFVHCRRDSWWQRDGKMAEAWSLQRSLLRNLHNFLSGTECTGTRWR